MTDYSPAVAIRSALHEWITAHTLLSTALQTYTNSCATLGDICTQPGYYPPERAVVEDALVTVNSLLPSLAAEDEALHETVVKLSTLRNRSGRLTRVNALPPEVLSHIFRHTNLPCLRDERSKGCYNALAAVSTYWRQIALNMPELWTHIDISPETATRSLYGLATTKIQRSRDSFLHFHLHEPPRPYSASSDSEARKFWEFLVPHLARTTELTLESPSHRIFQLWANCRDLSALRAFTISLPDNISDLPWITFWSRQRQNHRQIQRQNVILGTLRLRNACISLFDFVFRNLVELQLAVTATHNHTVTVSELAGALTMNPHITILKLDSITIINNLNHVGPPQVTLSHLGVLNLVRLGAQDLKLILPIISQPNPAAHLSVGLTFYDELHDEYRDFFSRCHVATLYHESTSDNLHLDDLSTDLARLVAFQSDISDLSYLPTESHPHVPRVTLVSCIVTFDSLLALIDRLSVEQLRLDMCIVDQLMGLDGIVEAVSKEMEAALYDARPGVACVVSDVDSSSDMSCRVMF